MNYNDDKVFVIAPASDEGSMKQLETDFEAFVMAVSLSVSAPTDERRREAVEIAESLMYRLSEDEIDQALEVVENAIVENDRQIDEERLQIEGLTA